MLNHKGKRLCITGIPASGKSYLAKKLAVDTGGIFVSFDDLREGLTHDFVYGKWVNFYYNISDEREYYLETPPDVLWKDIVSQSEGLWPVFLEHIHSYVNEPRPVIFECVNLLPHLVVPDCGFPEIVLLGSSQKEILERNKKDPRWGKTTFLQEIEAKNFFLVERPRYKEEGELFGVFISDNFDDAYCFGLSVLK